MAAATEQVDGKRFTATAASSSSLGQYIDEIAIPALDPDVLFSDPLHQWKHSGTKRRGCCPQHESESGTSFYTDDERLLWRCAGCGIGGGPIQYLDFMSGGNGRPRGQRFVELARRLCDMAGVPFPDRKQTPEQVALTERLETRREILTLYTEWCHRQLYHTHPKAQEARDYLKTRGFCEDDCKELQLGYCIGTGALFTKMKERYSEEELYDSGCFGDHLVDYVTFPWHDANGRPLTIYGKYPHKDRPAGKPKTTALPNPTSTDGKPWLRTKQSPMYLDRALRAGNEHLVLVEGVTDAALPQVRGDTHVVACVAATLSNDQVETLAKRRINGVTIALDPDIVGDKNIAANVCKLFEVGITAYVAPRLPEGMDPDEYILTHGMDEWRKLIAHAEHGYRYMARTLIAKHGGAHECN